MEYSAWLGPRIRYAYGERLMTIRMVGGRASWVRITHQGQEHYQEGDEGDVCGMSVGSPELYEGQAARSVREVVLEVVEPLQQRLSVERVLVQRGEQSLWGTNTNTAHHFILIKI